jgi:hypothetical protein
MAVFLLRSKYGLNYTAPNPVGTFTDVPTSSPFARWVEQVVKEKVMETCGANTFCPNNLVTRGKMAVYLVKSEEGHCFDPPDPIPPGVFTDVPWTHPDAQYIEKIYRDGVTAGCGPGIYCPDSYLTRGQMAVFLVVNYGLVFP